MAETPQPKGTMVAAPLNPRCRLLPYTIRRSAGSYGALYHISNWKQGTPQPRDPPGCENASTRDGGQRQQSHQTPRCNGVDTVQAARVSHTKCV